MKKVISKFAPVSEAEDSLVLPTNPETGMSKGVAFVVMASVAAAKTACEKLDNYTLDKAHILKVLPFSAFAQTRSIPEKFEEPPMPELTFSSVDCEWTSDEDYLSGCEQYVAEIGGHVVFYNIDPSDPATGKIVTERDRFVDNGLVWSPNGDKFASIHRQGAIVWKKGFTESDPVLVCRIPLQECFSAAFSPRGRYIMVYGSSKDKVTIYDIEKKAITAVFPANESMLKTPFATPENQEGFAFDPTDRYFIQFSPQHSAIRVFDLQNSPTTPFFVKRPKMTSFAVCPFGKPLVAYYTQSNDGHPPEVSIYNLDTRKEVYSQNLYGTNSATLAWHPMGQSLFVSMESGRIRSKEFQTSMFVLSENKGTYSSKNIADTKERVSNIFWEPGCGTRIAVRTKLYTPTDKTDPDKRSSLFVYDTLGLKAKLLFKVENIDITHVAWAPVTGTIAYSNLGGNSQIVYIQNLDLNASLVTPALYSLTDICWDPSGRYLACISSSLCNKGADAGYTIFSFIGDKLSSVVKQGFNRFIWRPHPVAYLTPKDMETVKKSLTETKKRLQKEVQDKTNAELERKRKEAQEKLDILNARFTKLLQLYDSEAEQRKKLSGGYDPKDPSRFA